MPDDDTKVILKPLTPQPGLPEEADAWYVSLRHSTLVELLDLWENDCYPSMDRAADFFEMNWDLVEELVGLARMMGLEASELRCSECNTPLRDDGKCGVEGCPEYGGPEKEDDDGDA